MLDCIKNRYSPKLFLNKEVEQEKIDEVIKAGLRAPSGRNLQQGIVICITNKQVRDELSKVNASVGNMPLNMDPFYEAPVVLIVAHKISQIAELNGAAMIENMLLEAQNQGLNAHWINRGKQELETEFGKSILKQVGLNPDEYIGIDNVILGYSNEKPNIKEVKPNRVFYIK